MVLAVRVTDRLLSALRMQSALNHPLSPFPDVDTRTIEGEATTVVTIRHHAMPFHRLELHLERAYCAIVTAALSDEGLVDTVMLGGSAVELLDQREHWPRYAPLLDELDIAWHALTTLLLMNARGSRLPMMLRPKDDQGDPLPEPIYHLFGRAPGERDVRALPFTFEPTDVDWRAGTITERSDPAAPSRAPRRWRVVVKYVGDRERSVAQVRRSQQAELTDWLVTEMKRSPAVRSTRNAMLARARTRREPPSGELFTRAWQAALTIIRAHSPDTPWGRRGPCGPRPIRTTKA